MDLSNVLGLLSGGEVSKVSKETGASTKDVTSVLTTALPLLAGGADKKKASEAAAKKTGLSLETVLPIITAALPLLQKLINTNADEETTSTGKKKEKETCCRTVSGIRRSRPSRRITRRRKLFR